MLDRMPINQETERELRRLQAQYAAAAVRMWSVGRDAAVHPFDMGKIGAALSRGPSRTRRLFVSSKVGSSNGNTAGSKDCLLRAQGHGHERPPA